MNVDCSIDIDAPAALVWEVFADVEHWPTMTASVTSVTALDGPGLGVGRRFAIKQPKMPKLVWTVTALDEGTAFTWEQRSLGATTVAEHRVERRGDHTHVRQRLEQTGWLGSLIGRLMAGTTRKYLDLEAAGLKRISEQRARGAAT